MKYYILDHELRQSQHGSEYYHVYIKDENSKNFHTYVYPKHHSKKIHNSTEWLTVLNTSHGIAIDDLKIKSENLIDADSIHNKDIQVFDTKQDMYDHLNKLKSKATKPISPYTSHDGLFEWGS